MEIESLNDLWAAVCEKCKDNITEIAFNVWIKDLHPLDMKEGVLTLGIYSDYKKQIVENNYTAFLRSCVKHIMGIEMDVKIVLEDENGKEITEKEASSYEDLFTFDNFIVGQTNRFAHAAAMAVADNPAYSYNPLVIYGPSGVGKTHLMLAIRNSIVKKHPDYKIEYLSGEEFTNQLIKSLQEGKLGMGSIDDFRNRYRNVDVLLIDDIHFIAGKASTQEEFFNTFNSLYQKNKQIVVTLDRPPKAITTLEDRIRSRLESGLLADITPADFETRVGIINQKCEQAGITLSQDIVFEIAKKIVANTRQLEGVVKKLQAYIQIEHKVPTIPVVKTFIKDVSIDMQPEPIKIEKIIEEVARTYFVSEGDILSNRKTSQLVLARQIAMYIARETTELSYKAIGESFGRDHTTALYSVKKVEEFLKDKPMEKETIDEIIRNLKNEPVTW